MPRERKYTPAAEDQRDYPADFTEVLNGNGLPLHKHFGHWVAEKTDAATHFKTRKELDAFELGAQFGIRYRMDHQSALDGGHAFHAEQAENRDAAAETKAARAAERKNKKAEEAIEEAPAPKRRGRPAKASTVEDLDVAPAKPAPRRGRPPRAAAAETGEAKATASARPARRPAAAGKPGRPARRTGKGGTEPAF